MEGGLVRRITGMKETPYRIYRSLTNQEMEVILDKENGVRYRKVQKYKMVWWNVDHNVDDKEGDCMRPRIDRPRRPKEDGNTRSRHSQTFGALKLERTVENKHDSARLKKIQIESQTNYHWFSGCRGSNPTCRLGSAQLTSHQDLPNESQECEKMEKPLFNECMA